MKTGINRVVARLGALAVVVITLLSSCASPKDIPGAIMVKGVVRYVNLEGGCWVMETGDNIRTKKLYELTGEDLPEVSINDAVITVWIVPKPDAVSTCQVGEVAEIVDVVDVEEPRK